MEAPSPTGGALSSRSIDSRSLTAPETRIPATAILEYNTMVRRCHRRSGAESPSAIDKSEFEKLLASRQDKFSAAHVANEQRLKQMKDKVKEVVERTERRERSSRNSGRNEESNYARSRDRPATDNHRSCLVAQGDCYSNVCKGRFNNSDEPLVNAIRSAPQFVDGIRCGLLGAKGDVERANSIVHSAVKAATPSYSDDPPSAARWLRKC
jgi:hypothetical protein